MREISFYIGTIELIGNGEARVGGPSCGDEICKGDKTTHIVKKDGSDGGGIEIIKNELYIIFHTITAYGEPIDSIPSGMTAQIIIPDTLAEQMRITWALEGICAD